MGAVTDDRLSLWLGTGGWLSLRLRDLPGAHIRLLMRPDKTGRMRVDHLVASDGDGWVSADLLRAIPIARIEAAASMEPGRTELLERIDRDGAKVQEQLHRFLPEQSPEAPPLDRPSWPLRLEVPGDGRRLPDSFYEAVANAYAMASELSRRPAVVLAEENGVPTTTVHRWVKEARRRGLMAAGQRREETS